MNLDQFKKLVKKQQTGTLAKAEQETLNRFENRLLKKNKDKVFHNERHCQAIKKSLSEKIGIKPSPNHTSHWLKIAASLVLLMGIGYLMFHNITTPQEIIAFNQQSSPKSIQLPDGSMITLNKNSKLIYRDDFNEENRNVKLTGEAFFSIASNKEMPFIVQAGKLSTEVIGTEFNIKEGQDNVSVTVTEGLVKVYHQKDTLKVLPNEQVNFNIHSKKLNRKQVNATLYSLWHKNEIVLKDATLEEITRVFEKLYSVTPLFLNEEDKGIRLSLSFNKKEDLQKIINRINLTNEVKLKKENNMLKIIH